MKKDMVKVECYIMMVQFMKEIGLLAKDMVMVDISILTDNYSKANSLIIDLKDDDFFWFLKNLKILIF
jgi:hypothetical protein